MTYQELYRFITPVGIKYHTRTIVDPVTGKGRQETKRYIIEMKPCAQVLADPISSQFYREHLTTSETFRVHANRSGICTSVNTTIDSVKGGGSDLEQEVFMVFIYPCTLSAGCASEQEIRALRLISPQTYRSTNLSNVERPVTSYVGIGTFLTLAENLVQLVNYKMTTTAIQDERSYPFPRIDRVSYSSPSIPESSFRTRPTTTTCQPAQIASFTCDQYMIITYYSSGIKTTITRNYKSLVMILSQIGGINTVLFLVCFYSAVFYAHLTQKKLLVSRIFPFLKTPQEFFRCLGGNPAQTIPTKVMELYRVLTDEGYKQILSALDVFHLVREVTNLRFLMNSFTSGRHRRLAPIVALISASKQFSKENLMRELESSNPVDHAKKASIYTDSLKNKPDKYGKEVQDFLWVEDGCLRNALARSQNQISPNASKDTVSKSIKDHFDLFCIDSLTKDWDVFEETRGDQSMVSNMGLAASGGANIQNRIELKSQLNTNVQNSKNTSEANLGKLKIGNRVSPPAPVNWPYAKEHTDPPQASAQLVQPAPVMVSSKLMDPLTKQSQQPRVPAIEAHLSALYSMATSQLPTPSRPSRDPQIPLSPVNATTSVRRVQAPQSPSPLRIKPSFGPI